MVVGGDGGATRDGRGGDDAAVVGGDGGRSAADGRGGDGGDDAAVVGGDGGRSAADGRGGGGSVKSGAIEVVTASVQPKVRVMY